MSRNKTGPVLVSITLLQACSLLPREREPGIDYAPAVPLASEQTASAPGGIYGSETGMDLFMDLRARAVGDILTILLVERTNASKDSSSSTSKDTQLDTGMPIIAGRPVTVGGTEVLNNEIQSSNSFSGEADATQSNRLDGSITVTVADRLRNGNLLVRGEKWITLNQGEEFIRFSGIVRPVDIGPDNSIPSTKVADAKITYSGSGTLANSSEPGWVSKFFNSPWFPF